MHVILHNCFIYNLKRQAALIRTEKIIWCFSHSKSTYCEILQDFEILVTDKTLANVYSSASFGISAGIYLSQIAAQTAVNA